MRMYLKKVIATILVLTLLSFFNNILFYDLAINAYAISTMDEEIADQKADEESVKYKAGDWEQARKDGCAANFFHNSVQDYLTDKENGYGYQQELTIKYNQLVKNPVTKKETKYGSADIYKEISEKEKKEKNIDGDYYLWEVKPYSYTNAERKVLAIEQLNNYINSEIHDNPKIKYLKGRKDSPLEKATKFSHVAPSGAEYEISFWGTDDSLILYNFVRKSNNNQDANSSSDKVLIDRAINSSKKAFETVGKKIAKEVVSEAAEDVMKKVSIALIKNLKAKALDLYVGKEAGKSVFNVPRSDEQLINALTVIMESADVVLSTHKIYKTLEGNKYIELDANSEFYKSLDVFLSDLAGTLPNIDETTAKEMYEQFINQEIDSIDEISGDISDNASDYETAQTQYQRDPLIINFSGTKDIEFTSLDDGINFDLDNNEFDEKTAWIKNHDGFLAIDLNSNEKIDNGGELFGDSFIMSDGNRSKTGFEALSSLNTSGNDKIINEKDAMFGNAKVFTNIENPNLFDQLIVWFDNNHNGITDDEDEISSLNQLNVDYIDLNYTTGKYKAVDNIPKEKGARQEGTSYVYFKDGTEEKSISEFWFNVNNSTTIHDGKETVGNVETIEQAIKNDTTDTLYELCLAFNYSNDISEKRCLLKKILYYLTDSTDIDMSSRGDNIDARDLNVIEAFMGHEFKGVNGENPNAVAAKTLKDIYKNIEDDYYNILNMKTSFGGYMTVTFEDEDEKGNKQLNFELLNDVIEEMSKENAPETEVMIYDLGTYLKTYDKIHKTKCFDNYKKHYLELSPKYKEIIDLIGNTYTFIDTNEDDKYSGSVYTDFIFSGFGDDVLQGGDGDDRYFFGIYHGNDTVNDTKGNNQIIFNDGFSLEDYDISLDLDEKFVLTNSYTDDSITLNDFIKHPVNYEFISENETSTLGGGNPRTVIEGNDKIDELEMTDGFNVCYGRDGDDKINGGAFIDFMYGGKGNDKLYGNQGVNVLFGEDGNDNLTDGEDSGYLNGVPR